jgi:arginine/lysine/ornithine decarboxylase
VTIAKLAAGIPIVAPGERIAEAIVDFLETGSAEGIYVEGRAISPLGTLSNVA